MTELQDTKGLDDDEDDYKVKTGPITLNVGGSKYCTSFTTLSKYNGSMLFKMFEGKFSLKPQHDGSYFIDRDGDLFRYILNYLRNNTLIIPNNNKCLIDELLLEAIYYQISPLIETLKFRKINSLLLNTEQIMNLQSFVDGINSNKDSKDKYEWIQLFRYIDKRDYDKPFKSMELNCKTVMSVLIILKAGNHLFGIYCPNGRGDEKNSYFYWIGVCNKDGNKRMYKDKYSKWDNKYWKCCRYSWQQWKYMITLNKNKTGKLELLDNDDYIAAMINIEWETDYSFSNMVYVEIFHIPC